jgi:hypothetical protein
MSQHAITTKTGELAAILRDGRRLIERMPDNAYRAGVEEHHLGGSVGMHFRHVLDHYSSFFHGLDRGRIDYDQRSRGSAVELERRAACDLIDETSGRLGSFAAVAPSVKLEVRVSCSPGHPGVWVASSVLRELDFLLGHTTHHYAIVRLLCGRLGLEVSPQFGMAPATLDYLASLASKAAG